MESAKILLDKIYHSINPCDFINNDPIQIPHLFSSKEDIEISGFLTSLISWGNRKQIVLHARLLMQIMNYRPFEFILNLSVNQKNVFEVFKHRTINGTDVFNICMALKSLYIKDGGLENLFVSAYTKRNEIYDSLTEVYTYFFSCISNHHSLKHISNVQKHSAAKRLNLFLRWMVRSDNIDLGIWKQISPSHLYIPLDTHTLFAAQNLGLLTRKQVDWKSVVEITQHLKNFDANDPIKYDLSLFMYSLDCKHLRSK